MCFGEECLGEGNGKYNSLVSYFLLLVTLAMSLVFSKSFRMIKNAIEIEPRGVLLEELG